MYINIYVPLLRSFKVVVALSSRKYSPLIFRITINPLKYTVQTPTLILQIQCLLLISETVLKLLYHVCFTLFVGVPAKVIYQSQ